MNKKLIQLNLNRFNRKDQELIYKAFNHADLVHKGQFRKSGKPYITHPLAVAQTVNEWGLDAEAIAAALLHDTVEDTDTTLELLSSEFSQVVSNLVDGLTKLSRIEDMPHAEIDSSRLSLTNENLRKLLLSSTKDIRVLLIKLADRKHNLQTLMYLNEEKRLRISRESLEIYAPLADRLGMGQLKGEIEDLSFRHFLPQEYEDLQEKIKIITHNSKKYISTLQKSLKKLLEKSKVEYESIEGRQKHLYSIYKKLPKVDGDVDQLFDLMAIRIIVPNIADCYQVLGIIHQEYKPLIARIKDYIAVPKPNGYSSLHTTVFALEGRITEIQIRTPDMHQQAEYGLAAHYFYDSQKFSKAYQSRSKSVDLPQSMSWVNTLNNLRTDLKYKQDSLDNAKMELFADRIFVFSPKGDLYDLSYGATALDFAFAIHTQIGLRTLGAKVNGKLVHLDTRLENRDIVDILVRKEAAPNRDWLRFVQTTAAKNKIRSWFRAASKEANLTSGRIEFESELKTFGYKRVEELPSKLVIALFDKMSVKNWDDVFVLIGDGSISVTQILRRLFPSNDKRSQLNKVIHRKTTTGNVIFSGQKLPYAIAPCCRPIFPENIIGYVTRGKGITIHNVGCMNLPNEPDRLTSCSWELNEEPIPLIKSTIEIIAVNRVGLLSDITAKFANLGLSISEVLSKNTNSKESSINLTVEVTDLHELATAIRGLKLISSVISVNILKPNNT